MRLTAAALALTGWFALLLQLALMLRQSQPGFFAMAATVVDFLSFFTILTNLLVALTLTVSALGAGERQLLGRPTTQTAATVYIEIVGVTYWMLLRHLWNPKGAQKLADDLLHTVMPLGFTVFWLIFVRKDQLRWKTAFSWLIYPGAYLVYLLGRGALVGKYPYPFVDAGVIGYPRTLCNAALFTLVFLLSGWLAIAVARCMTWRRSARG